MTRPVGRRRADQAFAGGAARPRLGRLTLGAFSRAHPADRYGVAMEPLPPATRRFIDAAAEIGIVVEPRVFPEGTRTSADAARAVGCELSAIAKSLVFMAGDDAVLVLISGDQRVDTTKLAAVCGVERARRASLDEAREHSGYTAGGTPAFGLANPLLVLADPLLRRHDEVWSAAGTPTTVYPIDLNTLIDASGARWADLAE